MDDYQGIMGSEKWRRKRECGVSKERFEDADLAVPTNPSGLSEFFQKVGLDPDIRGKRILDCGCGYGQLSTWLALNGAEVIAIDVDVDRLEVTRRRALVNRVEERVDPLRMSVEQLGFRERCFDLVVGRMILHHVDVGRAGREIFRVLKPAGWAAFQENSARNQLLTRFRGQLRRRRKISRKEADPRHPLTEAEVDMLAKIFGGLLERRYVELLLFRLFDEYVLKGRFASCSRLLGGLDRRAFAALPFLRKYGYDQVLVARKP